MDNGHYHEDPVCLLRSGSSHVMIAIHFSSPSSPSSPSSSEQREGEPPALGICFPCTLETTTIITQSSNNGKSERRLSLGEYKRAVSWSEYLVSSGAEIKGEGEGEWSADMSQLFIGNKFASGRHSRIYRGIYKQIDVAVKLVSQPEEDESLAAMLENHFISEVALLFRLRHPNIITEIHTRCFNGQWLLCAKGFTGTYRWMAPEMVKEKHHTKKVDVYSFGIVLWELLTAMTPFDNMTPEQAAFAVCQKLDISMPEALVVSEILLFKNDMTNEKLDSESSMEYSGFVIFEISDGTTGLVLRLSDIAQGFFLISLFWFLNARPPLPPKCPLAYSHLINRCWSSNPDKRPHFDEIVAILESYSESLAQDPEFLTSYKPPTSNSILRCFPRFIAGRWSASVEA
ncbi:SERINE/THREONINE-KINASE HT1-LIKE PROTEIN [Salix koriyanagi]|uniref:SERINE/THREONINE-KINASE HT1-LIKE PROTEIN n=1 Tax=Salix koriyanagi TaxID=2511006 RepID=A0A9Q0PH92_9ROSI|nr:SERINE/THREONINE-KINASE HT1-LIKE PROTEIN [Salix koriyanagi]